MSARKGKRKYHLWKGYIKSKRRLQKSLKVISELKIRFEEVQNRLEETIASHAKFKSIEMSWKNINSKKKLKPSILDLKTGEKAEISLEEPEVLEKFFQVYFSRSQNGLGCLAMSKYLT